jgi:ATP-binding cassette subfamily B (MDR/TAP) protein 1
MHNSKSIDIPIIKSHILSVEQYHKIEEEKKQMINVPYSSAIGSLLYAIMCTWFDICFVVGMVNGYQSNPGISHWKTIKRIF